MFRLTSHFVMLSVSGRPSTRQEVWARSAISNTQKRIIRERLN